MKTILLGVALSMLAFALPAQAAWEPKDVQKLLEKIKAGKGFSESLVYPDEQVQIVALHVSASLAYQIDLKAHLCFVRPGMGVGVTPIPCKNIKDAYPIIAPLITWEP